MNKGKAILNYFLLPLIMSFVLVSLSVPVRADWYWKPDEPNYAPRGVPDFDQKQDNWTNPYPPIGTWSWCGPAAVANSLWWLDSKFDDGTEPDGFPMVKNYGPWDDHDPRNVQPLIEKLAWYLDTDGNWTGDHHCGARIVDMEWGIGRYLKDRGLMLHGDLNNDGYVDDEDLAIHMEHFNQLVPLDTRQI